MPNKYQKEIEEILRQAGDVAPAGPVHGPRRSFWSLLWAYVRHSFRAKGLWPSPGRVMLIAVSLLLVALLMNAFQLGRAAPLAIAGLLLFIVGYGMFFIHPPKIEKRWRGQPVDDDEERWWRRIRRKTK